MKTYIIVLRGINVGGHNKIPMAELRQCLKEEGYTDVKTYIQSGNVILTSEDKPDRLSNKISAIIETNFDFRIPCLVKTPEQLQAIFDACPFSEVEKEKSYFILFDRIPDEARIAEVLEIQFENEKFDIINDCLYFFSSVGYGRTKFNMKRIEKKLGVHATSRNYKTMLKLIAMGLEMKVDQ